MIYPADLNAWQSRRAQIRERLWRMLGDLPPRFTPEAELVYTVQKDGYRLEKITFDNGAGATVYGYLLIPDGLDAPAPAVLYHHYHGDEHHLGKDELFQRRPGRPAPGPALVGAGYVVLAIDAYAFNERGWQGPAGDRETGPGTELSLFKRFLWEGRTLWGMMLRDDLLALNYLLSRPEVDAGRVGVTGMSLGGSRSTWLSALDDRIKVTIPIAQMTRYHDFATTGELRLHGIYYYVPGMLASGIDMEHLVSLTAPRAQRILIGSADPLSPVGGVRAIDDFARHIYGLYDAADRFETVLYDGVGHEYTPDMLTDMLRGFGRDL